MGRFWFRTAFFRPFWFGQDYNDERLPSRITVRKLAHAFLARRSANSLACPFTLRLPFLEL